MAKGYKTGGTWKSRIYPPFVGFVILVILTVNYLR